jgi:hypothetical protein
MAETSPELKPADREDVLHLLAYAVAFNLNGKARRNPYIDAVDRRIAAEAIYEHLRRSGFVIFAKRVPENELDAPAQ